MAHEALTSQGKGSAAHASTATTTTTPSSDGSPSPGVTDPLVSTTDVGAKGSLVHVKPSPVKPALQAHVKPPAVLAHDALGSQPAVLSAHSSTSAHVLPSPL